MRIETLVSTMNKASDDDTFIKKMNLYGDVLVCNQSTETKYCELKNQEGMNKIFTFDEIGIGRSRNTLLLRSKADICVLSDDDMIFVDNFQQIIKEEFLKRPEADLLIFNIDDGGIREKTKKDTKINKINYTKYGAARIVFKRDSIVNNDIFFSLNFGGGATYGSGEDTLFLKECLDKKLKVIAIDKTIAILDDSRPSTWFEGFNEKFFYDKGALYYALSKPMFILNLLQFSFRKHKLSNNLSFIETLLIMTKGAKNLKYKRKFDKQL